MFKKIKSEDVHFVLLGIPLSLINWGGLPRELRNETSSVKYYFVMLGIIAKMAL